jgi:hypothetical protein
MSIIEEIEALIPRLPKADAERIFKAVGDHLGRFYNSPSRHDVYVYDLKENNVRTRLGLRRIISNRTGLTPEEATSKITEMLKHKDENSPRRWKPIMVGEFLRIDQAKALLAELTEQGYVCDYEYDSEEDYEGRWEPGKRQGFGPAMG